LAYLHLGNTSGRNNFNDFPDNQLTKLLPIIGESKFCSYLAAYGIPVWQSAGQKWRYDFKPTKEVAVWYTGASLRAL